jgi:hypothetical protein
MRSRSSPRSGGEVGPSLGGDAGEIIDTQAQSAYRRRITALEDEIEEARAFGDSERAAALEHELDFLVRELAGALGLHGRRRRTGTLQFHVGHSQLLSLVVAPGKS